MIRMRGATTAKSLTETNWMAETTAAPANKAIAYQGKPAHSRKSKAVTRKAAKGAINRGLISEKAAKRHLDSV